jgi:D-alanyl-D-alanine carboxypeptidase
VDREPKRGTIAGVGHNFASRAGDQIRNWDGDFMFRKDSASRLVRVGALGLFAVTQAVLTSARAEAHRYHHYRHYVHHRHHDEDRDNYSPQFSSIIVDANSGATLSANSPDGIRHPASLTKIMTLYLLFERLEAGKMKLDTEMAVSEHASEQAPTKLGLRPGQTIKVEDAIKGLVTRSANDAAVVIAEAIAGNEDDFAKMMTRQARAIGMSHTTYRNASGLPNDEQVTTARDQATLGRAIQDRFPRYYRYFSTLTFNYHGQSIRNHNHLLGEVEGVDGIKTGYTQASGFNLVTSMHRGNRYLVGVVMGGHSGGSRDAIMRGLLAENLAKASTTRTVTVIAERNPSELTNNVAESEPQTKSAPIVQAQAAPAAPDTWTPPAMRTPKVAAAMAEATAAMPSAQAKIESEPLSSGVIQTQAIAAIPGSSEPMRPVRVKTVQIKAGAMRLASAGSSQQAPPATSSLPQAEPSVPETSSAVVAKAAEVAKPEAAKPEPARPEPIKHDAADANLPPQPAGHGTGNGLLGVLPASSAPVAASGPTQAVAVAATAPQPAPRATQAPAQPQVIQQNGAIKPMVTHTGWIVQVGALESEEEAQHRIEAARNSAKGLLSKADPFTEPVIAKDNRKLYRARFAGLERGEAEAVCRTLRRSDISCITVRN